MNEDTIYTIALEMLETTNVYKKKVEALRYELRYDEISLLDLIVGKLSKQRSGYRNRSQANLLIAYDAIADSMIEYHDNYPSSFAFKQRMKEKFCEWLDAIKNKYEIRDAELPEELKVRPEEFDTAVVMIKELHSRRGVSKEDLKKKLNFKDVRTVQKNLRKLSPSLYEGEDFDKDNVYMPFRLGGQPLHVNIQSHDENKENRKYYRTLNTLHPIVLQENLMQVGTLLQALCRNYYDYESNISTTIAIDIWSQLSEYAKMRIEKYYCFDDQDMADFIELLKDECPDNHACGYRTEMQMFADIELPIDESIRGLLKGKNRTCTLVYRDEYEEIIRLENQHLRGQRVTKEGVEYEFHSSSGKVRRILKKNIDDLIIEL